ncbi:TlpA family protein disulfide reductase [Hydrogenothermus marinus]|uniref:F plasmid transfer operon protein TraF n=1 Tax=Hydrogenothermus marinus TaxID=133270 RepID=A0A3M0B7U7_9AQUI|nr:TlpA disulfide reductase family protein [Hydrogenothermus marinus]RMA92534.1 F plasmid transfer operon protein TraF [Hydrogenothermus marinus]
MRAIILTLVFALFFSCNEKEKQSSLKKIPKNAIVVDINGNPIELPKDKLIILNFMAYSCSACMKEIPVIKKVLRKPEFKDKFYLVGLVIDTNKNDLSDKEFPKYANNKINFIKFPVPGTPTTYIITPKGKKLVYIFGAVTEENFEKFLKEALRKYKGAI